MLVKSRLSAATIRRPRRNNSYALRAVSRYFRLRETTAYCWLRNVASKAVSKLRIDSGLNVGLNENESEKREARNKSTAGLIEYHDGV